MKSPDFDFVRAHSVAHTLDLLREHGDNARILAGGQTLLATLNMRLSEPALLIDITGLEGLRGITAGADGWLRIGALSTHTAIESSATVAEHAPLLALAAPHIAHRAIRNAGTWGGSIAYGDPAAEWPTCLCALDGVVRLMGPAGERRMPATDFYQDLYTTALAPDELVLGADVPLARPGQWFGFDELARRHGDYAVVGLAVAAHFEGLRLQRLALGFLGVGNTPVRARATEAALSGQVPDPAAVERALAVLRDELDPPGDLHHSGSTKRHLATVLTRRLLGAAYTSRRALVA